MKFINQSITYKAIGVVKEGKILEITSNKIIVAFSDDNKTFLFPEAFEKFLRLKDEKLQEEVEALIAEKKEKEAQKKIEEREAKLRAIEEAKRKEEETAIATKRRDKPVDRHANENNLAFKCNFCNGGCSESCLGYKGVCSDEQIKQNIKDGRAWCSNADSPCYKYVNGMLTRKDLDDLNANGTFVCYEARMLIDWKAEAGEDVDENGVHRARRITNASNNSLAVLTTVIPGDNGKDRVIFGVFITGTVDEGDDVKAGYVKAKGDYHIELTPEEANQMKFWHYYKNSGSPDRIQWGTGLYRYMKDSACARILADIVNVKTDLKEKAHAQKVLEHYCSLKGIDIKNIPTAEGAI